MKFQAEGREFAKILSSLEQFIQTVKGQNNFYSWRFLGEQNNSIIKIQIGKNYWDLETCRKSMKRKYTYSWQHLALKFDKS